MDITIDDAVPVTTKRAGPSPQDGDAVPQQLTLFGPTMPTHDPIQTMPQPAFANASEKKHQSPKFRLRASSQQASPKVLPEEGFPSLRIQRRSAKAFSGISSSELK